MAITTTDILNNFIRSVLASLVANIIYDAICWCLKRFGRFSFPPTPHQYTDEEIKDATLNLSTPIASAMGNARWGSLHGTEVAVCLPRVAQDRFDRAVIRLSQIQHENVMEFLGYCKMKNFNAIVYKLGHHKSLREILDDVDSQPPLRERLNWSKRLQIAADVARGIAYIHYKCRIMTAHGHLRSSNILINKKMRAQISGLLEAVDCNGSQLDDIHELGIVLFELITGQNAGIGDVRRNTVAGWAKLKMNIEGVPAIVDPVLNVRDMGTVDRIASMALFCVKPNQAYEISISKVLTEIQYALFQEENFI